MWIEPWGPEWDLRELAWDHTFFLKPFWRNLAFFTGMVGIVEVNSDGAVWSSSEFENLLRSSSDAESGSQPGLPIVTAMYWQSAFSQHVVTHDHHWIVDRVAAACLICWWSRENSHILHWLLDSLSDIVFSMTPQGTGTDFLVKKFGILAAETDWQYSESK